MKILITGATGNVGIEVIRHLFQRNTQNEIIAGVRSVQKAKTQLAAYPHLYFRSFDFEDSTTFSTALKEIDLVFLLRPPHIADIQKYFIPLIQEIKDSTVKGVVFLSVQGAEKSKVIPHNKIEQLLSAYEVSSVLLRPSYFMQNLTTTLLSEIQQKGQITLPSGYAPFNWVDVQDIGEVAAITLEHFDRHAHKIYEITGFENIAFPEVVDRINTLTQQKLKYRSVNPISFYFKKRKEGIEKGKILVMLLLHFLPRFQKAPRISSHYEELTGKKPTTISAFIKREQELLTKHH